MKKLPMFLLTVLTVLIVSFGVTACAGAKEYTVTFVYDNGQENYTAKVEEGKQVVKPQDPTKAGFEFDGWFVTTDGATADSAYDFEAAVTGDLTLTAKYHEIDTRRMITFTDHEYARYIFDGGVAIRRAEDGETVKFKVKPSVFCAEGAEDRMIVSANDREIDPDRNGYYSFTVNGDTTVRVDGISIDRPAWTPETVTVEGSGTVNVYRITRPAHLNLMIENINNLDSRYLNAAYLLDADLDLEGEEISPIGAVVDRNENGGFMGIFFGNGHVVSNFTVSTEYPTVGLFGYQRGMVVDLHVKDVHYDIDCEDTNYFVGGIAGMNMGQILVSSFEGEFTVASDSASASVFLGGIAGGMQSISESLHAAVEYCEVKADIASVGSEALFAVGGIVGASMGGAESASSYATNCTYSGNITENIMFAGGIVGRLGTYSSIANCYTEGEINIENTGSGLGAAGSELKQYGAAGGLVGLAETESAVTYSFGNMSVTATGEALDGTEKRDGARIGCAYTTDSLQLDENECVVYNSFAQKTLDETQKGYDYDTMDGWSSLLGWSAFDWTVVNGVPKVNYEGEGVSDDAEIQFDITFYFEKKIKYTENEVEKEGTQYTISAGGYTPIGSSGMNAAISTETDGKWISYGYFLDEEHTQRIPAAMLLTQDIPVYVGFANYNEIPTEPFYANFDGHDVKLEFVTDLSSLDEVIMIMTEGGTVSGYRFSYDGKRMIVRDAYFPYFGELFTDRDLAQAANFAVDFVEGTDRKQLSIHDKVYFTDDREEEIPEEYKIRYGAIKAFQRNALTGRWYDANNSEYFFRADGTGYVTSENGVETGTFTYTFDSVTNAVSFTQGGVTMTGTFNVGSIAFMNDNNRNLYVSKFDDFRGKWEAAFSAGQQEVEFNGSGLTPNGKVTYGGKEYAYSVTENGAEQTLSFTAEGGKTVTAGFNDDGLMVLSVDGAETVYGKSGSYIGTWIDPDNNYVLVLSGIGKEGYGFAEDSEGYFYTYIAEEGTDSAGNPAQAMVMFEGVNVYAPFIFSSEVKEQLGEGTLAVLNSYGMVVQTLYSVDALEGVWLNNGNLTYEFNGLGLYHYKPYKLDEKGEVVKDPETGEPVVDENAPEEFLGEMYVTDNTVSDPEKKTVTLPYVYSRDGARAEFTYNNVKYYADFMGGKITVADEAATNSAQFVIADNMYGMRFVGKMKDGELPAKVSFDGKSNLGSGTATLDINGKPQTMSYTIDEAGVVTLNDGTNTYKANVNMQTEKYEVRDGEDNLIAEFGNFSALAGHTYYGFSQTAITVNNDFTLTGATGSMSGKIVSSDGTTETDVSKWKVTFDYYDEYNVVVNINGSRYGIITVWSDDGMGALFMLSGGNSVGLYEDDGLKGDYTDANGNKIALEGNGYSPTYGDVKVTTKATDGGEDDVKTLYYVVKPVSGEITILDLVEKEGEKVDYEEVELYKVYLEETDGATAYTDASRNKTIWVKAVPPTESDNDNPAA